MSKCPSRYTVVPGDVLECGLLHEDDAIFDLTPSRRKHVSEAYGVPWYWSTAEEDKQ